VKVNSKLQSEIDRFSDASDSRLRYVIFYHQFLKINLGRTLSVYLRANVRGTRNTDILRVSQKTRTCQNLCFLPIYASKAVRNAPQDIVVSRRPAEITAYLSMEPSNKRCPGSFTEPSPFT
jgi:hypothetical protein